MKPKRDGWRCGPQSGSSGQTFLEAMIAIGVFGILIVSTMQLFNQFTNSLSFQKLVSVRNRLALKLVKAAQNMSAYQNSLRNTLPSSPGNNENAKLLACVTASAGFPPPADCVPPGTPGTFWDFRLYSPVYVPGVNGFAGGPVTGTSANPMRYDINGFTCDSPPCDIDKYPFEVYTQFRPNCGPPEILNDASIDITGTYLKPPAGCDIAESISVKLVIQPSRNGSVKSAQGIFPPLTLYIPIETGKIASGGWWN